jgi:ABC-type lipoprotein export system ATPase subunit
MSEILTNYPHAGDWLQNYEFLVQINDTFTENINSQGESFFSDLDMRADEFVDRFYEYLSDMESLLEEESADIHSVSILPGIDKSGDHETFERITINKGDIVGVVGPTGSGKSQLLADIEWGARGDTPTKRTILVNDQPIERNLEMGSSRKLVAQLSQNMNFVVDLSARDFLQMHANCWLIDNKDTVVDHILDVANQLAGESFAPETHITNLSGGQSRALMIADCAYLSAAPIVLIDEIENAGIDRRQALDILAGVDKIVLMATHDPILALMADYRLIIKNGGVYKVIYKSENEQNTLHKAEEMNEYLSNLRDRLRQGLTLV